MSHENHKYNVNEISEIIHNFFSRKKTKAILKLVFIKWSILRDM